MSSKTTSRRKFLKETLSGIVFLSVAKLLPSEILLANDQDQVPNDLLLFSPKEYLIFEAAAERIIGPASPGQVRSKDVGVAARADQFLAGADPEVQEQIHQLLSVFNAPLFTFLFDFRTSSFLNMSPADKVTVNDERREAIWNSLRSRNLEYLQQGLQVAANVQFAGGAKKVMTLHARPTEFQSLGDVRKNLARADWGMNEIALYSAHPLGTCRMGADPKKSVVDAHCQSHDVKGLFVIDGSLTPTSLGVNPQVTILAIAEKSAEWLAEHFSQL